MASHVLGCRPRRKRLTRSQRDDKRRADRIREANRGKRSDAEKRAIRKAHADANRAALERLTTLEGMEAFLIARELNPQLSNLAAARVAMDAPGKVVNTFRGWKSAGYRIRKGEQAISAGTRPPSFWPDPLFALEQTDAPDEWEESALEDAGRPDSGLVAAAVESLRETFERAGCKTGTLNNWIEVAPI